METEVMAFAAPATVVVLLVGLALFIVAWKFLGSSEARIPAGPGIGISGSAKAIGIFPGMVNLLALIVIIIAVVKFGAKMVW